MRTHSAEFSADGRAPLRQEEGNERLPYLDSLNMTKANASIGIGFNLALEENLRLALYELGILNGILGNPQKSRQQQSNEMDHLLQQYKKLMGDVKTMALPPTIASQGAEQQRLYRNGILAQQLDALTGQLTNGSVSQFAADHPPAQLILSTILHGGFVG